MEKHGVKIYPDSEKKPWDRAIDAYPPQNHVCMLEETEFAETYQEAQTDLERREKNRNQKRTMMMWKNALDHTWRTRLIQATQRIIDGQPKVMRAFIEADGGRTSYYYKG